MSQATHDQLSEAVKGVITTRLEKYLGKSLDKSLCIQIYQDIFKAIQEIVLMTPVLGDKLHEEGINYIAQAYYDMLDVYPEELDPSIFTKRVNARDLSNEELAHCGTLLRKTPIINEIVSTIKTRS